MEISEKQKEKILEIAKKAVYEYVLTGKKLSGDYVRKYIPEIFNKKEGIFVTIYKLKELRGCIGFTYPVNAFGDALIESAVLSASADPRFEPINKKELDKLSFEVTILGKPEPLDKEKIKYDIQIGKDGLIVSNPYTKGLLLPQVAVEENLDSISFLEYTCIKAGLDKDAWKESSVKVYKFKGDYFS